jgi:UDP-N-acetylmuramoyl-L-alanyl-D-glutamate--2,6-diaminopimelate ligase
MNFELLLKNADIRILNKGGDGNPDIQDICYDSRKITQQSVYVAIPGTKVHGDSFIKDAISKGAVAIISENQHSELNIPWVQCKDIRAKLGILGCTLWNVKSEEMDMVGITGTNGKTTTAHLYQALLKQKINHDQVWMFGTIEFHIGAKRISATHTTPETIEICKSIGSEEKRPLGLVMEVSSHSLALDRVGGLLFNIAVWTNLTQDHLDFHKNMENYYLAKKKLFTNYLKNDGVAVVNIDDPWGLRLVNEVSDRTIITYGKDSNADFRILSWSCDWDGGKVSIVHQGTTYTYSSSLRGFFNIYNMTSMIAGAMAKGYTSEIIQNAFDSIETVAGRMDRVTIDANFAVVVDYAHTPDALVNILTTARPLTKGKLICVFGCGGDRDRTKRPIMGGVVAEHADEAVVTSDNPRSERPVAIIDEICDGIPLDFPHVSIADRKSAIKYALSRAEEGDCIIIAGKGHEDYQEISGVKHHFNDKEVVAELYSELRK